MKRMSYRKTRIPDDVLLAEARRIYAYRAPEGLVWKAHANPSHPGRAVIGAIVGGDDGHGYRMCMLCGHKFKVHQVVWLLHHGKMPQLSVDHIDHNRRNNTIENLRLATDFQNGSNISASMRPTAGTRKDPKGNGFRADISVHGKRRFIGYFSTQQEARAAFVRASREERGEFSSV